jgi:hypothetical protein
MTCGRQVLRCRRQLALPSLPADASRDKLGKHFLRGLVASA